MWFILGIGSIIFAILNLVWSKYSKWFGFISLSLTALTICTSNFDVVKWIEARDIAALEDVVPSFSIALLVCTIASIVINAIPLIRNRE